MEDQTTADITIRNLDDGVKAGLGKHAADIGRSMEAAKKVGN